MTPSSPEPGGRRKIIPVPPRPRGELTGLVMEAHRSNNAVEAIQYAAERAATQRSVQRGTHWFYWIAALSLLNSLVSLFGGHLSFLIGLAASQIADAFAMQMGPLGLWFSLGFDLVAAFFLCGLGYLASHGSRAALIGGMVLYGLDGAIFLLLSAYLPALFHAYVLYQIFQGWKAAQKLDQLRAAALATAASNDAAAQAPVG